MTKLTKIVLVLLALLLLAGCAGYGMATHSPDRICSDPVNVADCRYGGDSDTDSDLGGDEGDEGDDGEGEGSDD